MDAVSLLHHHITKITKAYGKSIPINFDIQETGEQTPGFQCTLTVGEQEFVSAGQHNSKKAAKQAAALVALRSIATDVPYIRRALSEIASEQPEEAKIQVQTSRRLAKVQNWLERTKAQNKTSVVLLSELSQLLGLGVPDYTVQENYGAVGGYSQVPYKCSLVVGDHYFRTVDDKRYNTMQEAREACAEKAVGALVREVYDKPQEQVELETLHTNYLALLSIARPLRLTIHIDIECVPDSKLKRFEATAIAKDHQDRVVYSTRSNPCVSKKAAKEAVSSSMIHLLKGDHLSQVTASSIPSAGPDTRTDSLTP
ncbi:hypothetical protein BCR43DRAFT_490043 [Syncephalastrum racemosum]|uniref:DRBM domain-containing protein n=1 Tax=Syncephalastrum racemosum TaxID=13706 RepID=A0A1X2HFA4_SYNRA|nr:hypothetical protein BCR43DRAFT_490043 [Syncephalastrum racemosum]